MDQNDFEQLAARLLSAHDEGTATYVSFAFKHFTSLVCSNWKTLKCEAGVAAEAVANDNDKWQVTYCSPASCTEYRIRTVKVVEMQHCGSCKLTRALANASQARLRETSDGPIDRKLFVAPTSTASSGSRASSPETPLSSRMKDSQLTAKTGALPAFRRLSASSGLRVKLVHRDSAPPNTVTSPIRSPAPKPKPIPILHDPAGPPQLDEAFSSLDSFHATTKRWINATYPQYAIYFRSRKGDRPEFYCKYQNSPHASTTPGLGCKFGFNAKRRMGADGKEVYVVTKVRLPPDVLDLLLKAIYSRTKTIYPNALVRLDRMRNMPRAQNARTMFGSVRMVAQACWTKYWRIITTNEPKPEAGRSRRYPTR